MKIKLTEKFFISQCTHASFNWDLIKISYGNRNGEENVKIETPVAFGLSLQHLMNKIGDYEIFENESEFETFEKYIEEYKKINEEVLKQLKSIKLK